MTTTESAAVEAEHAALLGLADRILTLLKPDRDRYLAGKTADELEVIDRAIGLRTDPGGRRVYKQLGYEPICKPRVLAALAAGYPTAAAAAVDNMPGLPPMCGRCPAERFDAADEFDVFFGGAAGGSKTFSMVMLAVRLAVRWPGLRALFLRETFDDLDENVFPVLRAMDYASVVGGEWNAGRKELNFKPPPGAVLPETGKSAIRFRYMENIDDVARRQGGGYQLLLLDERTLLPPGVAGGLMDRLRSVGGIPVIGIRSTGNPGGRAHGELKNGYVVPSEYGRRRVKVRTADGTGHYVRRFIPAKATDNPYLNEEYYTVTLASIPDPARRRAMRDGDWDVFAGAFFDDWTHGRHVVPRDAVQLSRSWPRYEGIDYGRAAPWCMLRGALDGDGRLWLYRELYKTGLGEREQARLILEDEKAMGDRSARRAGDPAMWAKVSDADAIADTYAAIGVPMAKANNDRTTGWARVHSFLADGVTDRDGAEVGAPCPYHAALDWETCPMLHVLEGTCPNLVRTLPDLPFDKHRVEDLDTDAEDHAADALRYLVMELKPPRRRRRLAGAMLRAAHPDTV